MPGLLHQGWSSYATWAAYQWLAGEVPRDINPDSLREKALAATSGLDLENVDWYEIAKRLGQLEPDHHS